MIDVSRLPGERRSDADAESSQAPGVLNDNDEMISLGSNTAEFGNGDLANAEFGNVEIGVRAGGYRRP